LEYLGLTKLRPLQTVIHLAAFVVFIVALEKGTAAIDSDVQPEFIKAVIQTAVSMPLLLFAFVIMAPVFEEIFFRGFMFKGIAHSPVGPLGAIIITSVIFASIHIQYDILGIAQVFLLGLWLAGVRAMTGSTTLAILLHASANLYATFQAIKAFGGGP
jgi:membrane protease YdiL (CAAX protease family)